MMGPEASAGSRLNRDQRCRLSGCENFVSVATNLENLEYSGISVSMENSGNSQGIL